MKLHRIFASLCAALMAASTLMAAEDEMGFRDEFETYHQEYWNETLGQSGVLVQSGAWMRNITIKDGKAFIEPVSGQQFLSSNLEFESADLAFEASFETFGTKEIPCMYYLGFRNPQEACYFMIQEGAIIAVLSKNGTNRVAQPCGTLELGKTYHFEIKRRKDQVELLVDGKSVYLNKTPSDIPQDPMPLFLAANVLTSPGPDVKKPSAQVTLDNVEIKSVTELKENEHANGSQTSATAPSWSVHTEAAELVVEANPGIGWKSLKNKTSGQEYLSSHSSKSSLFVIDIGDERYSSRDFAVESTEKNPDGGLKISLRHAAAGLSAVLTVTPSTDGLFRLGLEVQNLAEQSRTIQTTFPILGPVTFGDRAKEASYFYPWRSGILGQVDCNITNEYGSGSWMQVVAMMDTEKKNGLYLFPEDSSGRIKGIHLKKQSGTAPLIRLNETIYSFTPRSPFNFPKGLGVSYYYVPKTLAAGEKQVLPSTRVAVYSGAWREALSDYGKWTREWYRPVKTPRWFSELYTFVPRSPKKFWSESERRYNSADHFTGDEDMVQWSGWHDYVDRTANPSKNLLENWNYGDYEYNQSRGGLKPFVEEIRRLQSKGVRFTVYTDPRFCWRDSKIGKAHGKEWAAMYAPGSYGYYTNPDDTWMTSLYEPNAWADYYADMCARIMRDTGMDGIYLDELMFPFPNYNPAHTKYHDGESPVPVALLAANVRKIRDAIQAVNPEGTIMVEHAGSDWLSQVVDGCWIQTFYPAAFGFSERYFDENSLVYFHFLFPELKLSEWGGGLDSPRRSLFNGIGIDMNSYQDEPEKFKEQISLISRFRPVFHEVANIFAGHQLEMLIPTLHEKLLANSFTAEGKKVYTLYNKSGATVTGPGLNVPTVEGHHYVELVADNEVEAKKMANNQTTLSFDMPQTTVGVIAVLPTLIKIEKDKNDIAVSVKDMPTGSEIWLSTDDDKDGRLVPSSKGSLKIDAATLGKASKVIVKVMNKGHLVDQAVVTL